MRSRYDGCIESVHNCIGQVGSRNSYTFAYCG
jgi:hypothetical protein